MTLTDAALAAVETGPEPGADKSTRSAGAAGRPRLGCLGVGWIGRNRMEAVARSGIAQIAAVADTSPETAAAALESLPSAECVTSYEALLEIPLDGIVIATPSALHARQSIEALERGLAVFCQKPLGRTVSEVREVVDAARRADRLLGVDFSYRFVEAFRVVRDLVHAGEIGDVYAVDLTFHNAYGPDKAWFYDPTQAGGGCLMDLGIHLVDLALWAVGFRPVRSTSSRLLAGGKPIGRDAAVEDFATGTIDLEGDVSIRLACSWNLPAGCDAVISAEFYGTEGGAAIRNVSGSFYDFVAERYTGTRRETLVSPPDDWSGRAAVAWAERLSAGERFDEAGGRELIEVAEVIDRLYAR